MELNLEPVKVDLQIETPSLERGAFYSLCFITENDEAPRTLEVKTLSDLLNNGYVREDLAYNFCIGVFAQQGIDTVYIRAKRSSESYVEAYDSEDNSAYYFVVLQTKDLTEVEGFNSHLVSSDEMKLQFFSQNVGSKILQSPKLVNYYQDYTLSDEVSVESKDYYLNKAYGGDGSDGSDGSGGDTGGDTGGGDKYQIEVVSDNSNNGNAGFYIELNNVSGSFSINLNTGVEFNSDSPNTEEGEYYFSREIDDSGKTRVYLSISELGGKKLDLNINAIADVLVINSDWTPEEEGSGRGIIVNEIPYGVSNIQFKTWSTFLVVPNYLPDTITSLERTFENCENFDSDISNWDTSRVTSLSNTFSGCKSFMQDISRWDVSNVTDMEYAFIGAHNFNSDLSRWNVGKVESFKYAFNTIPYFDSDLSQWDTSSARNMFRMFASSPRFSSIVEDWDVSNVEDMNYMFQPTFGETSSLPPQDLSRWCVTKIPFPPLEFVVYDWAGTLPIWGTCPRG